ncbi:hypothetical protein [Dankookia sp. P2]|uniref:class I SAM-dependent methyltransferase n=1 Tax=Dankookia sp. P2 TaxID=3423955 RepID=UPI003D66814E
MEDERLGDFDVILSMGVLHHLSSPARGLRNLVRNLTDDGMIFLYVYGRHGGQERMRRKQIVSILNGDEPDFHRGISLVKDLGFDSFEYGWNLNFEDDASRDALIVDAYLNVNETLFDFDGLLALLRDSGLSGFMTYGLTLNDKGVLFDTRVVGNLPGQATDVAAFLPTPLLRQSYEKLDLTDKCRLMDLWFRPNGYTVVGFKNHSRVPIESVERFAANAILFDRDLSWFDHAVRFRSKLKAGRTLRASAMSTTSAATFQPCCGLVGGSGRQASCRDAAPPLRAMPRACPWCPPRHPRRVAGSPPTRSTSPTLATESALRALPRGSRPPGGQVVGGPDRVSTHGCGIGPMRQREVLDRRTEPARSPQHRRAILAGPLSGEDGFVLPRESVQRTATHAPSQPGSRSSFPHQHATLNHPAIRARFMRQRNSLDHRNDDRSEPARSTRPADRHRDATGDAALP